MTTKASQEKRITELARRITKNNIQGDKLNKNLHTALYEWLKNPSVQKLNKHELYDKLEELIESNGWINVRNHSYRNFFYIRLSTFHLSFEKWQKAKKNPPWGVIKTIIRDDSV